MFTDYIHDVKENAFRGVFSLTKKSFIFQVLAYVIFTIVFVLIALLFAGGIFSEYMNIAQNPQDFNAMRDGMASLFLGNIGIVILLILVSFLLMSWFTTFALSINHNLVKKGNADFSSALKDSFSKKTLNMLLYYFVYTLIYIIGALAISFLGGLLTKVSFGLGWFILIIGFIVFSVFLLRLIAGPAYIVHGDQTASQALTSSIKTVTWVRSLIFIVIAIGITVIMWLLLYIIALIVGTNTNLVTSIATGSNITFVALLMKLIGFVINGFFAAFIYAGISSLYFRYNNIDAKDSIEDHLVDGLV